MLSSSQIHGNRQLLLTSPEPTLVFANKKKSVSTVQLSIQPFNKRKTTSTPKPCWKPLIGRHLSDAALTSPTLYGDSAFASLQHAFFACLLSFSGGGTSGIQYRFYPNGTNSPPFMVIDNPTSVGFPSDTTPLVVHMMSTEPSHPQLLQFASQLRRLGYHECMLLLGTMKPVNIGKEPNVSDMRGMLLHLDTLVGANDGSGAYPSTALEHGWKVCFTINDGAALCFALNGQRSTENGMEVLQTAVLPSLTTIGLRLWRRGDVAHALMPKSTPCTPEEWEKRLKRFLESLVE